MQQCTAVNKSFCRGGTNHLAELEYAVSVSARSTCSLTWTAGFVHGCQLKQDSEVCVCLTVSVVTLWCQLEKCERCKSLRRGSVLSFLLTVLCFPVRKDSADERHPAPLIVSLTADPSQPHSDVQSDSISLLSHTHRKQGHHCWSSQSEISDLPSPLS